MIMGTTISNTQIDKRKKLLDLPEDVITVLSVQAAKEGKSAKAFMEGLLISAANDLEDITTSWLVKPNKKPLNRNMVYHECRIFKAIFKGSR